ncbi:hypothetical protein DFH11DRAFT_1543946 [Phellopilus nigrolimitatus]|nr:hypothetical protein DFH11DRAFT_1543946 [Phellopilus nigrolimitatus]
MSWITAVACCGVGAGYIYDRSYQDEYALLATRKSWSATRYGPADNDAQSPQLRGHISEESESPGDPHDLRPQTAHIEIKERPARSHLGQLTGVSFPNPNLEFQEENISSWQNKTQESFCHPNPPSQSERKTRRPILFTTDNKDDYTLKPLVLPSLLSIPMGVCTSRKTRESDITRQDSLDTPQCRLGCRLEIPDQQAEVRSALNAHSAMNLKKPVFKKYADRASFPTLPQNMKRSAFECVFYYVSSWGKDSPHASVHDRFTAARTGPTSPSSRSVSLLNHTSQPSAKLRNISLDQESNDDSVYRESEHLTNRRRHSRDDHFRAPTYISTYLRAKRQKSKPDQVSKRRATKLATQPEPVDPSVAIVGFTFPRTWPRALHYLQTAIGLKRQQEALIAARNGRIAWERQGRGRLRK